MDLRIGNLEIPARGIFSGLWDREAWNLCLVGRCRC